MPIAETSGCLTFTSLLLDNSEKVLVLSGAITGPIVVLMNTCCSNTRQLRCSKISCCGCSIERDVILEDTNNKHEIIETDDEIVLPPTNNNTVNFP